MKMNFMEALKEAKNGKKIRSTFHKNGVYCYIKNGILCTQGDKEVIILDYVILSDWFVVNEEPLWSKRKINVDYHFTEPVITEKITFNEEDVKESLKKFYDNLNIHECSKNLIKIDVVKMLLRKAMGNELID